MTEGNLELSIVGIGDARRLRVSAPSATALADFEGTAAEVATGTVLDGPLSAANAAAVRIHVPSLRPQPIGLHTSAGVGDRLGLAGPGQVRAFQRFGAGIVPIFAQQSAREMDRLGRTPQQVLDDATFGCLQAGWDGPVGADSDHLKSTAEIDRCLDAGFTLLPGKYVIKLLAVLDRPGKQPLQAGAPEDLLVGGDRVVAGDEDDEAAQHKGEQRGEHGNDHPATPHVGGEPRCRRLRAYGRIVRLTHAAA